MQNETIFILSEASPTHVWTESYIKISSGWKDYFAHLIEYFRLCGVRRGEIWRFQKKKTGYLLVKTVTSALKQPPTTSLAPV